MKYLTARCNRSGCLYHIVDYYLLVDLDEEPDEEELEELLPELEEVELDEPPVERDVGV